MKLFPSNLTVSQNNAKNIHRYTKYPAPKGIKFAPPDIDQKLPDIQRSKEVESITREKSTNRNRLKNTDNRISIKGH